MDVFPSFFHTIIYDYFHVFDQNGIDISRQVSLGRSVVPAWHGATN